MGEFTEESTQRFPPVVTIDKVQVRIRTEKHAE